MPPVDKQLERDKIQKKINRLKRYGFLRHLGIGALSALLVTTAIAASLLIAGIGIFGIMFSSSPWGGGLMPFSIAALVCAIIPVPVAVAISLKLHTLSNRCYEQALTQQTKKLEQLNRTITNDEPSLPNTTHLVASKLTTKSDEQQTSIAKPSQENLPIMSTTGKIHLGNKWSRWISLRKSCNNNQKHDHCNHLSMRNSL